MEQNSSFCAENRTPPELAPQKWFSGEQFLQRNPELKHTRSDAFLKEGIKINY
jgi:hypothetical protein